MNASKNLVHFAVLAGWAVLGAIFTLKCVFVPSGVLAALFTAATWWLWFGGLAAGTSVLVSKFRSPIGSLAVHAITVMTMLALPREVPFGFLRFGIDLIRG